MISFSIIVPIFKPNLFFLDQCFLSIICNLGKNDEIICVFNGVDENTIKEIKNKYNKEYFHFYFLSHADVSDARNEGIKNASNEYIIFVDCDDIISKSYLSKARKILLNNDVDFICFCDTENPELLGKSSNKNQIVFGNKIINLFQGTEFSIIFQRRSIQNKVYRRSILLKNSIFFNSGQKLAQDTPFNFKYCNYVSNTYLDDLIVYLYRVNNQGSTTTRANVNAIDDIIMLYEKMHEVIMVLNLPDDFYIELHKETILNYLPYIFRRYIFDKSLNFSLIEQTRKIKGVMQINIFKESLKKAKLFTKKNNIQNIFILLLKLKTYYLISIIYRVRKL